MVNLVLTILTQCFNSGVKLDCSICKQLPPFIDRAKGETICQPHLINSGYKGRKSFPCRPPSFVQGYRGDHSDLTSPTQFIQGIRTTLTLPDPLYLFKVRWATTLTLPAPLSPLMIQDWFCCELWRLWNAASLIANTWGST